MPSSETINHILDKIGLVPSATQQKILGDTHKVIQIKGGWRAGKSTIGSIYLITRYWLGSAYAIVGVDYELCRPEFKYLMDFGRELGIIEDCHFPSRDQCILTLSRGHGAPPAVIETKSAKYPERIAGKAFDGIILAEAAQLPFEIFNICRGRLVETNGWMLAEGTLESSMDWYADKSEEYAYPGNTDDGISYSLPSWENLTIFPGGRQDPKILREEASLGHDMFMERYGGETIKPKDLVLPAFKTILHTGDYPYEPGEPVFIGVDVGYFPSVYAVEFIQYRNDEIYVIDEIYVRHLVTEQIIKLVADKPFSGQIEDGAIDIAAKQHQGAEPVVKYWKTLANLNLKMKKIPIEQGIDAFRYFFIPNPINGGVRIHIDKKCVGLISELGGCKSPFAEPEGGFKRGSWRLKSDGKPDENNCDATKAIIYETARRFGLFPRKGKARATYSG